MVIVLRRKNIHLPDLYTFLRLLVTMSAATFVLATDHEHVLDFLVSGESVEAALPARIL